MKNTIKMKRDFNYKPIIVMVALLMVCTVFKFSAQNYAPVPEAIKPGQTIAEYIAYCLDIAYALLGNTVKIILVEHKAENLKYLLIGNKESIAVIIKLVSLLVIFFMSLFKDNKKVRNIATVLSAVSIISLVVLSAMQYANAIEALVTVVLVTACYLCCESKAVSFGIGFVATGLLGNFIDGNIHGYVTDYLWLFANVHDQVYNLEDLLMWGGGIIVDGLLAWFIIKKVYNLFRLYINQHSMSKIKLS